MKVFIESSNKVDKEKDKGLYSKAFMISQATIRMKAQISFINSINQQWI